MKKQTIKDRFEAKRKITKKILQSLRLERVIKVYGFPAVKSALNHWVTYQRENAKLLREKEELEEKLIEINKKI